MPIINVRDTSLYYEVSGDTGIPLLFIHGMCGGGWVWEDQVRRLSGQFTCISYDRRGHSRSAPDVENQSDATHAADAVALIQTLGLDHPIIVASSGGAVVAAELLHRYPGTVRAAVLSEPPLFSVDPVAGKHMKATLAPAIEDAVADGGARAAVDAFFERVCGQLWLALSEAGKNRYRDNSPMLLASLQRAETEVSQSDLASIDLPTLLVTGSESLPELKSIVQVLAANLPNARVVELAGAGHVTYAERPEEFAREVRAFAGRFAAESVNA